MQLFNTKKVRDEWEKRVEDSYNQGKEDAINDAKETLNKAKGEKKDWEKLSEKELLVELMYAVSLNNERVNNFDRKVNSILSYNELFNQINSKFVALDSYEKTLNDNLHKGTKLIDEFLVHLEKFKSSVDETNKIIKDIASVKEQLGKIQSHLDTSVLNLEDKCEQIDYIASNLNSVLYKYSDSPIDILCEIKDNIDTINTYSDNYYTDLLQKLEEIKEETDNLHWRGYDVEEIKSNVDDIKNKVDSMETEVNDLYWKANYPN